MYLCIVCSTKPPTEDFISVDSAQDLEHRRYYHGQKLLGAEDRQKLSYFQDIINANTGTIMAQFWDRYAERHHRKPPKATIDLMVCWVMFLGKIMFVFDL